MPAGRMHADEVDIDVSLVGRLLAAHFPHWADLPIEPVHSAGTVNATDAVTAAWEAALQAAPWRGPPVWIHGDLRSGNLLALQGRLSAVIDFGSLGMGDPACDLMVAWNLLSADTRGVFRATLPVDDATWARGRGWALSVGLIALPYYRRTNPVLAGISRYAIAEVLAESRARRMT